VNNFHIISIPRPLKTNYNKILVEKLPVNYDLSSIHNIKNLLTNTPSFDVNITKYVEKLYNLIGNPKELSFIHFRDVIYDIFIYDMEIGHVVLLLLKHINEKQNVSLETMSSIYIETYSFLQYYNNNYRPIYHLENYLYSLINKIHGL